MSLINKFFPGLVAQSGANAPRPAAAVVNDEMPTYKEVFVAPKLSLVACLMKKPALSQEKFTYDYDSAASDPVIYHERKLLLFSSGRIVLTVQISKGR